MTVERYKDGEYKELELELTLMSSADFGKLEYSQNTSKGQNDNSEEEIPKEGSEQYSDEDMRKFYEYFKNYFGDN